MFFSHDYLQFPNDPVSLLEWFVASVALVIIVTLVYVYILSKSPQPEGETVSGEEQSAPSPIPKLEDPSVLLLKADAAIKASRNGEAVEISARVVSLCLTNLIQMNLSVAGRSELAISGLGIADMAYLVQAKAKSSPQIAEPIYQLNSLRLKAAQGTAIEPQQASWAFSIACWFCEIVQSGQIRF